MSRTPNITRRALLAGVASAGGLAVAGRLARAAETDAYGALLARYVVASSDGINRVDYAAWQATPADHQALTAFIEAEARRDPSAMPPAERFAYWTNLYNALTLAVVLDAYPVRSIRDIRSKGRLLDPKSLVWMAPALQGFCDAWRQVRSGLVSGLLMRLTWPLALMGSAERGPFCFADS